MSPTWETATDWDSPQDETGVHHEQPSNTDWAAASKVEKGYPSSDEGGSSLEAYWPCDEDSGSTLNDVSGSGRDISMTGGSFGQTGVLSTDAILLDGNDDEGETNAFKAFSNGFTSAVWYTTSSTNDVMYCSKDLSNGAMYLRLNDGGFSTPNITFRWQDGRDAKKLVYQNSQINDGNWHQVATTHDGTDTIRLYFDGAEQDNRTDSSANGADDTSSKFWFGEWSGGGFNFDGTMDELRLYSRELPSSEISDLFNAAL